MQHQPVKQQIQCLIHQIGVEQPPEKPFRIEPGKPAGAEHERGHVKGVNQPVQPGGGRAAHQLQQMTEYHQKNQDALQIVKPGVPLRNCHKRCLLFQLVPHLFSGATATDCSTFCRAMQRSF